MSLILLFQSFGICYSDLSQIDKFIEHAAFHSEQYGDNIVVFISKHYGESKAEHNKEHQEEQKEHENLPFQHQSHLNSTLVYVLNTFTSDFKAIEIPEFKTPTFYYQEDISSLHSLGLLQPPRLS